MNRPLRARARMSICSGVDLSLGHLGHDPATVHRPADPALLAREAEKLLALGLSVADAAHALGLSPRALADLLANAEQHSAEIC